MIGGVVQPQIMIGLNACSSLAQFWKAGLIDAVLGVWEPVKDIGKFIYAFTVYLTTQISTSFFD